MKKLSALLIVLVVLSVGQLYAQPQATIHIYGGYDLPLPDFKGTYPGDTADSPPRYFQKWGLNIGVDGKYFFGSNRRSQVYRRFGITLSANYHNFTSGEIDLGGGNSYKREFNIVSVGLGIEYHLRPNEMFNPFMGAEGTGNFFIGGKEVFNSVETKQESETRLGVAFGVGADLSFQRNFGMVIGAKYHIANVSGKDTNFAAGNVSLNDGATATQSVRLISWIGFYVGASIYFNRPKNTKTKRR